MLTKDQAVQIADLAVAARPYGARRWQAPEVVAALALVQQYALDQVVIAALTAAADRAAESPAVIGDTASSCWRHRTKVAAATRADRHAWCSVCGLAEDRCREVWADDHTFIPVAEAVTRAADPVQGAAALREALAEASGWAS